MKRLVALVQDRPIIVTLLAVLLVAVHWAVVQFTPMPNSWAPLIGADDQGQSGDGIAIYLGAASAAAIVAGFAGVVVVFGLTAGGERFRKLRVEASGSLPRNWTSASVAGFAAAGLSLAAAVSAGLGLEALSPWIFELSMLLLLHGTLRIIWLLRALMRVVRAEDLHADRASKTQSVTPSDFS